MFYKSMFYKSMFYKSMFYKSMFYKSMFYKSMFCFTSTCYVLQVQSIVYKSSPVQGPVYVLQHAYFGSLLSLYLGCLQNVLFSITIYGVCMPQVT
jgi:hypothetical protein